VRAANDKATPELLARYDEETKKAEAGIAEIESKGAEDGA